MKYIMMIIAALALTACGVDYSSSENSNNTTTTTTTTTTTSTPTASTDADINDTNATPIPPSDGSNVPEIANYSTGVVVLDCANPANITGKAVYKCLKPDTEVSANSPSGLLVETDNYKVDDRFVFEFIVDDIANGVFSVGDEITVTGFVGWNGDHKIEFATASCKVGG